MGLGDHRHVSKSKPASVFPAGRHASARWRSMRRRPRSAASCSASAARKRAACRAACGGCRGPHGVSPAVLGALEEWLDALRRDLAATDGPAWPPIAPSGAPRRTPPAQLQQPLASRRTPRTVAGADHRCGSTRAVQVRPAFRRLARPGSAREASAAAHATSRSSLWRDLEHRAEVCCAPGCRSAVQVPGGVSNQAAVWLGTIAKKLTLKRPQDRLTVVFWSSLHELIHGPGCKSAVTTAPRSRGAEQVTCCVSNYP